MGFTQPSLLVIYLMISSDIGNSPADSAVGRIVGVGSVGRRAAQGIKLQSLWKFSLILVQEKLLTVTLVTVTQYRASWLQWHFSDFPISNIIVKFSCLQWHSISHSLTVTLFGRSRGCHCNRLLLYQIICQRLGDQTTAEVCYSDTRRNSQKVSL